MNGNFAPKKVYEALNWASSFLQNHQYEPQIGERLLLYHTGWTRSKLFAEYRSALSLEIWEAFERDVKRAAEGYPVQYITGEEIFCGRTFRVNEHVLIPRQETEELIEYVLREWRKLEETGKLEAPVHVVDVGTGSGIIAVTLKLERESEHVTAIDISKDALRVAEKNANRLQAEVEFLHGDLLEPLMESGQKMNIIVSNPPYVREGDRAVMKENVLLHEPMLALFAGEDGLDIYRKLVTQIPYVLTVPGIVAFEIGHGQGEQVASLLRSALGDMASDFAVQIIHDINKKERIVIAVVQ